MNYSHCAFCGAEIRPTQGIHAEECPLGTALSRLDYEYQRYCSTERDRTELARQLNEEGRRLDRCLKVMRAVRDDLLDRARVEDGGVHVVELSNTPWRWLTNEIASLSSGTAPDPDVDGPAEAAHSAVVERRVLCDHPVHSNPGLIVPCPKCGS